MDSGEIKAWVDLQSHAEEIKDLHLAELFRLEADRFGEFSFSTESFLLDLSKQRITKETLGKLTALVEQQALGDWRASQCIGGAFCVTYCVTAPHRGNP